MPEASVVITSYRRAHLLRNTLESIRAQRTDCETIVVSDGGDDDEYWVYSDFEIAGMEIYLRERINRPEVLYSNQSVPLNMGVEWAEGDILILQNAECMHEGNVIEK